MAKKYKLKGTYNKELKRVSIDDARFSINYEQELNTEQYKAACAIEGSYLIIAGAGTGKTRTLVYRVARLVELGYDPQSILLLTFTRKAAREMMNRAAILLDNRCSKINGGTFHSFANLSLRKYAKAINLDSSFTILDQGDSEDVINLIRAQLNFDKYKKRFPNKSTIYKILSLSVNTERDIQDILEEDFPHFAEFTSEIQEIRKYFNSYKEKNNLLDYDDLLIKLRQILFENRPAAQAMLSKIKFVMVDEYQDTNKLQSDIVKGLTQFNNNVMVVGDDSQSIYSFRGANFKNIMEFPKLFPQCKLIKLEENYRSTQDILNFANKIIDDAVEKYPKHLFTRKGNGELPGIISAANENMQSRFIVERILELREEGVPLSDIAVLFRSSFFSFDLEIELGKANIPFIKVGGMKFVEAAHVKDVISFLRILANPKDIVSWYRVLLLHEGIGPKTAQKIIDVLLSLPSTKIFKPDSPVKSGMKSIIVDLLSVMNKANNPNLTPLERSEIIVEYYQPYFKDKYDDFNKRQKDLDIFLNISEQYRSLDSFLADMALDPPEDSVVDISEEGKETEKLVLSTIHSAKGLEWHTVFIIHAMEGFFPSGQALQNLDSLEEERRLMYVASTRAKQNLYVSYPMHIFDRYSGFTFAKPSRFISSITEDLAEEWLIEEEH